MISQESESVCMLGYGDSSRRTGHDYYE
jgi:hypothetical protein